uniref:Uncharacterized protein n=1 Tax=Haptolina ericina TaxID=156174 RepID=A0A7S3AMD2_9EUKA|mmetsp:Transcript_26125/g.59335  ORF Transcript_26125/g.59335 Transcript_26125/m.59335 type:complete len:261 (+) Transcript_26125:3-785(+)
MIHAETTEPLVFLARHLAGLTVDKVPTAPDYNQDAVLASAQVALSTAVIALDKTQQTIGPVTYLAQRLAEMADIVLTDEQADTHEASIPAAEFTPAQPPRYVRVGLDGVRCARQIYCIAGPDEWNRSNLGGLWRLSLDEPLLDGSPHYEHNMSGDSIAHLYRAQSSTTNGRCWVAGPTPGVEGGWVTSRGDTVQPTDAGLEWEVWDGDTFVADLAFRFSEDAEGGANMCASVCVAQRQESDQTTASSRSRRTRSRSVVSR